MLSRLNGRVKISDFENWLRRVSVQEEVVLVPKFRHDCRLKGLTDEEFNLLENRGGHAKVKVGNRTLLVGEEPFDWDSWAI